MRMQTVYKYPIEMHDNFLVELPIGAYVLTVQVQHGTPYIWALVDTESPTELRPFRLLGTGHPIEQPLTRYIGTFQLNGGALVFHLFECLSYEDAGKFAKDRLQKLAFTKNELSQGLNNGRKS
jgi:hypothetical protein